MPPRLVPPSPEPLIPIDLIPPRQQGESAYRYRERRTFAIYGQTTYQRRIWLASQRGIGITAARGHAPSGGETEFQRRNRISIQQTGYTYNFLYRRELRGWLEEHGYNPQTTGMTWTALMRIGPRLRWMYEQSRSAQATIMPEDIYEAKEMEIQGELEPGWAETRLWNKYESMVAYRQGIKDVGFQYWTEYLDVQAYIPSLTPAWWYYH